MAGKEAIVFAVDCHQSMAGNMELAREAVRALMVQKMLQSKSNEMGVILFGLPKEETDNTMNKEEGNEDEYLGLSEFCRIAPGNTPTLRRLKEIGLPNLESPEDACGDILDAMILSINAIKRRTDKKKYLRHVYLVTDAATCVEGVDQLEEVVDMYRRMECKLHFVSFGSSSIKSEVGEGAATAVASAGAALDDVIKDQNEKMLGSVAAVLGGTVMTASTVVDVMGSSSVKMVNPVMGKVDLCVGTKLAIHFRYFKKTDTFLKESLKKESIPSSLAAKKATPAGAHFFPSPTDGKVRVDRVYRDPEMPDVEIDYDNQVKGFRYGQDYIPVNTLDAESLKLPNEPAAVQTLGFISKTSVPRHYFMDDTFVLLGEPASVQCTGAICSLVTAMRNLKQVAIVRFVRPVNRGAVAEPWMGVLMPDDTSVSQQERLVFQKLPYSEDLRDFTFPSFQKPPPSRQPSEEQMEVAAELVDAMMIPAEEDTGGGAAAVRSGLVLNPVLQSITQLKVARAVDPGCKVPSLHPTIKAGVEPDPDLLERATPVLKKYTELFRFEKQEKTKTAGDKKRVTYFSDLTLAEPGEDEGKNASTGGDGGDGDRAAKRSRADRDNGAGKGSVASSGSSVGSTTPRKVGSINPVADFEAMMARAFEADGEGSDLADRAMKEMQVMIHTLARKGTTTALRTKAVNCVKVLRRASVSHFLGNRYNDFLTTCKDKYQYGDHSDLWEMLEKEEKAVWPVTTDEDASLAMSLDAAAAFMKMEQPKKEEEQSDGDDGDDDDLDDMA